MEEKRVWLGPWPEKGSGARAIKERRGKFPKSHLMPFLSAPLQEERKKLATKGGEESRESY